MSKPARYLTALLIAILLLASALGLWRFGRYGWTLFILLPALLGGLSSWTFRPATPVRAIGLGVLTPLASSCLFLLIGLEGLACIALASPLVVPHGAFGGWLGYLARSRRLTASGATLLLLLPPATFTWDSTARPALFEVRSQVVVATTPEQVWKHVVTFSELPEPQEWFFHTGLAYPKRAYLVGLGPGAIRYCEFSTGAFVEPIEVWDAPHLLRFRVAANPAPLRERTPYGQIETKHLHGYLISKQGQFRLTPLANGRTLLEGTTWYQHGLWPQDYWRWWSDAIIHRIHLRVLNHVRTLAEQDAQRSR